MNPTRPLCAALLALALGACATDTDHAHRDAASIDPVCEREMRAARAQPVAAEASEQEARALRGQHMSLRCQRAWNDAHGAEIKFTGRDRIPSPVPPRPR